LDAEIRAAAAEAKLELMSSNLVMSVVHSEATPAGRPEQLARAAPWWKFWRRD
jgi:hypothetical protein